MGASNSAHHASSTGTSGLRTRCTSGVSIQPTCTPPLRRSMRAGYTAESVSLTSPIRLRSTDTRNSLVAPASSVPLCSKVLPAIGSGPGPSANDVV